MRRPPGPGDARAAWWTWRALRAVRSQLRAGAVRDVVVPSPPSLPEHNSRAVRRVLRRVEPSCLERALVLQRWLVLQGDARDVIVGTEGSLRESFHAHAWLDGEPRPPGSRFVELTRLSP
jgi:hypothetical protein